MRHHAARVLGPRPHEAAANATAAMQQPGTKRRAPQRQPNLRDAAKSHVEPLQGSVQKHALQKNACAANVKRNLK
jgi:hypothetical protein